MHQQKQNQKTLGPALAASGIYLALAAFFLFRVPAVSDPTGFGVLRDKLTILESASSPKIIFVGGSNLLFGIDGMTLYKRLGYDVVNMGLCFNFRLPFMLAQIKEHVRRGDIVVISPEYQIMAKPLYIGGICADGSDLSMPFIAMTVHQNPQLIPMIIISSVREPAHLAPFLHEIFVCLRAKAKYIFDNPDCIASNSWNRNQPRVWIYDIDPFGDLRAHLRQPNHGTLGDALAPPPGKSDPRAIALLNDFNNYCKSRDARCYLIPAPLPQEIYQRESAHYERLCKIWREKLNFPVLGTCRQFTYPQTMFHLARYHLHAEGRRLRTESIAELLAQQLKGDPSSKLAASKQSIK
ncbi:MAG TPA: hypothetical protein V6D17_00960 [Candidatus Obscuribacterales bacterium]